MSFGFTGDFLRKPLSTGIALAGPFINVAGAVTTYGPVDVTDYSAIGVVLRSVGIVTGFRMVMSFYADTLATQLVQSFTWDSFNGAAINDVVVPPAPTVSLTITPFATGGGRNFTLFWTGYGPYSQQPLATDDAVLISTSQNVAAGAQVTLYATTVTSGQAYFHFHTLAASWNLEIDAMNYSGGISHFPLIADPTSFSSAFSLSLILSRYTHRVFIVNNDAVARGFQVSLIGS